MTEELHYYQNAMEECINEIFLHVPAYRPIPQENLSSCFGWTFLLPPMIKKKQDFMYLFPSLWVYLMNHKIIHL